MRREFLLILSLACLAGCAAQRELFSTADSPPTTSQIAAAQPAPAEAQSEGFSFSKVFQMVGFQKPEAETLPAAPSLVPPQVTNLGNMINVVTERSAQLNVNDPPEVTRQKAQAILESLQTWDNTLAAGYSTGLVNNEMARTLDNWVAQIRGAAQNLVQYGANPQTIASIQQLSANLRSTFGNISTMLNQGGAISQAFLGGNRG